MATFAGAKGELKARLAALDELLNRQMYGAVESTTDYDAWLRSHQPFHWLAEFYEIINDRGGFDVIIGNPPYVEISKVTKRYKLNNYTTIVCGNLYACVYERSENISRRNSFVGMIVQLSIVCTDRMSQAQKLLLQRNSWILTFDDRPGKLFDDLQHIRATIFLSTGKEANVFTTKYIRWYTESRSNVFNTLVMTPLNVVNNINSIPKIGNEYIRNILDKMLVFKMLSMGYGMSYENQVYVHNAPQYFTRATNFIPYFWNEVDGEKLSVSLKSYRFCSAKISEIGCCVLNSSIFYLWFIVLSDCRHLNVREIDNFPIGFEQISEQISAELCRLDKQLMIDYEKYKNRKESSYKSTGKVVYDEYFPKKSKPIIDEIDKILAVHYGFTEEELDFIINYDIKYRMGDELNEE